MANVTFLTGFKPFKKHFSKESTTSYPLIKTVSSQSFDYEISNEGLIYKTQLISDAAKAGACLLKGPLKRPLVKESRAGVSDKNAATQSIILDIDGLKIPGITIKAPLSKQDIWELAENVVQELPDIFQEVSYIVHASASLGMKENQVRLHLDFATQDPIPPSTLKNYLTQINLQSDLFFKNTELTATSKALTYPVDRCLAENSRLIFIGHPSFDGIVDPIPNQDDRIFYVEKEKCCVNVDAILQETDIAKNEKIIRKRIFDLRASLGLGESREKTQRMKYKGAYIDLVTNPDHITMTFFQDHGKYVTYNINGGDSHGYYVKKDNPNIVWNFKGEQPFLFSQADPEAYNWHLENFAPPEDASAVEPFVFRDIETNVYYNGFFSPSAKSIEFLKPTDKNNLLSFMVEGGGFMPDHPPQWRLTFDPNNPIELNRKDGIVNLWQEPQLLSELMETPELKYGEAAQFLEPNCQYIHQTLMSLTGCDPVCYEHFINWLAFIFQTRGKTQTAWLFHGVEGTGKGVLSSQIIKPMLENRSKTRSYYHSMRVENIKEQFNDWMETTLIAFVDEFKAAPNTAGEELYNKIKNYITEEYSPIRRMRKGQELVRNRCNIIFTSNDFDAMEPGESDRRMNVAPRQETPIEARFPGYKAAIMSGAVAKELPLFASIIMHFEFDSTKAMSALNNNAKRLLRNNAADTTSGFIEALKKGDLMYFTEVIETTTFGQLEEYRYAAANYARIWLRDAVAERPSIIAARELKPAYNVLVARQDSDAKFDKIFARRGYQTERIRRGGLRIRGFEVKWNIEKEDLEGLKERYLTEPTGVPNA